MMVDMVLPLRVGLQQRIFPSYRSAFFDSLAAACGDGLSVFAGQPLPSESVQCGDHLEEACLVLERNIHYFAGRFYLYRQPALQDWLAKWNPQVLVAEVNPRNLSLPAAIRWMHRHNRRVIGWGLGAPANQGISSYLQHANWRRFIHQFDNLVTYSQKGAAEYITAGFEKTNIIVAPNAVAPRQRFPMPQRPQEFSTRPVVLFVGRLQDRKKVDNLIRACAALPPGLQPDLWIVGDGPARNGLELLAGKIYPSAEFTGARHGKELQPFFLKADLFVLPGTGGLAIQQAMSYGLPVIAAEADGTQQDLVRPTNGWQIPPGNLARLTETLSSALSDVTRLRQMGKDSYQIVHDEINVETMVKMFIKALSVDI